jgi:hypothetical protein
VAAGNGFAKFRNRNWIYVLDAGDLYYPIAACYRWAALRAAKPADFVFVYEQRKMGLRPIPSASAPRFGEL